MLVNIHGIKSKQVSLKKVMKKEQASIVLINETLLTGNMKISLSPYSSWYKNRTEKGGGGVATAVSQQYKDSAVGAEEGQGEDEYLITRLECFSPENETFQSRKSVGNQETSCWRKES